MNRKGTQHLLNVVVLAVVLGATGTTGVLLARTMRATDRINDKAAVIAAMGQGINVATDSIIQLTRTNETASAVLESTQPLAGDLATMLAEAKALDALSGSIDDNTGVINATVARLLATARTMNGTADDINGTTKQIDGSSRDIETTTRQVGGTTDALLATTQGINASLADLLDAAKKIGVDVGLINGRLDIGIGLDQALKVDSGNLLTQVGLIQRYTACLDRKVAGNAADSHC